MIPDFNQIAKDFRRFPVVVVAHRGHGKSTSVKTIIQQVKDKSLIFKIFDTSQSWFHCAPVKWRQRIFKDNLNRFTNIGDCVYEIGNLTEDERRSAVARIIKEDYTERYFGKLIEGAEVIDRIPWIVYVFEECETYFDSRSLNKKDEYAEVLRDFVKVGRNYGLSGIMIVQVMIGELATKIRRRCGLLMGQVVGSDSLREIKARTNKEIMEQVKSLPQYHWIYWNRSATPPFKILDLVRNKPSDYMGRTLDVTPQIVQVQKPKKRFKLW